MVTRPSVKFTDPDILSNEPDFASMTDAEIEAYFYDDEST